MKQILWFRRDLRIQDSALLANAKGEVLPIFIFDRDILDKLPKDDKRVTFIYKSVLELKKKLQSIGLDLAIFYGKPIEIIQKIKHGFDEILCSIDFDEYAIKRDEKIEKLLPMRRFLDSFILEPSSHLTSAQTPYKVFTPFYKSLDMITSSSKIECYQTNKNQKKVKFKYATIPTLKEMGFELVELPVFTLKSKKELFSEFENKIQNYETLRNLFYKDGTSNFSVHLRFGLISPREVFNHFRSFKGSQTFIQELFWREFYNYILYHFPKSQKENFRNVNIQWRDNKEDFTKWCEGQTGVPIIDAAMRHLNKTGLMPNRLRMITASFLTKNLFIDWKKGEEYFAKKLLDYEVSSNVGSWQWAASTGVDAVPYFRIFNPYTQSKRYDIEGIFIKSVIKELKDVKTKLLHVENGVQSNTSCNYPKAMVDTKVSRKLAIEKFKALS